MRGIVRVKTMERKSGAVREKEAIEAALRIIEREGIGAVSVRKVAAEAGMSAGSLRHIFPQHDDLLVAVFRFSMGHTRERVAAIVARAEAGEMSLQEALVQMVMQVLPVSREARIDLLAQLAVLSANPAHEGIRAVRAEASEGLDELCESVIARVEQHDVADSRADRFTSFDAAGRARRLRYLIDGMALNILDNPSGNPIERIETMITEELFGTLTQ